MNLNRAAFDLAALLRAENNSKTPDALYLAAAIHAGSMNLALTISTTGQRRYAAN